ncbi:MAG: hypothetical protein GXX96_06695 [Planctomycetaceae bacterium]|nr:hypothetical protein [Planctomycetaceae bacterium]
MRQHLFAVVLLSVLGNSAWAAGSWVFQPSTYSHDPQTGERVAQYAAEAPAYGPSDPTYQQSAYIHKRTALYGVPGSIERRHYVETWGEGEAIRPYGEWERPYRAGATPYGPWGNPSGPWTTPFGSWVNPYGLGKLPTPPWYPWYPYSAYGGAPYPPYGGGPIAVPYGQGGQGDPAYPTGPGYHPSGPGGYSGGHETPPPPRPSQGQG